MQRRKRQRLVTVRGHHDAWVNAWLARAARDEVPIERHALFDRAFAALWRGAYPTIGELTLSAVLDRAIRDTVQMLPRLSTVRFEAAGDSLRLLREGGEQASDAELAEALRVLLVELLSALGALTGEALTPLLHRELAWSGPPRDREGRLSESGPRG